MDWFHPDGTINTKRFSTTVFPFKDRALRRALYLLKDAAIMSDSQQVEHLLSCESPGIMCTVAAALPHIYLESPAEDIDITPPPRTLHLDMQRVEISGNDKSAYIELGKVTRTLESADVVRQLGTTLATVGWFVRVCCNVDEEDMQLVGRTKVPKGNLHNSFIAAEQQAVAKHIWNFNLHVHTF